LEERVARLPVVLVDGVDVAADADRELAVQARLALPLGALEQEDRVAPRHDDVGDDLLPGGVLLGLAPLDEEAVTADAREAVGGGGAVLRGGDEALREGEVEKQGALDDENEFHAAVAPIGRWGAGVYLRERAPGADAAARRLRTSCARPRAPRASRRPPRRRSSCRAGRR